MNQSIDFDTLDAALRRCGSSWDAAQSHGLLSGRVAVAGELAAGECLAQVLEGTEAADALRGECEALLGAVFETTLRQLAERQSAFEPLLPGDDDPAGVRARALAHWCEGFLHGLVSGPRDEAIRSRLADEPLADIIRDMLEITRAAADDESDTDESEAAYAELVEYVRVAAQLTYEELVHCRPSPHGDAGAHSEVLH